MKQIRLMAAAVALAALNVIAVSAQTQPGAARPAGPAAQPAAPPSAAPAGPARVAVIDSRFFGGTDEKGTGGIVAYVEAAKSLEAQFTPMMNELKGMEQRYNALVEDIRKTSGVADPAATAKKQEQAQDLEVQFKRKQEDYERQAQTRRDQVMGPIVNDVFKAVQQFAQQRGYTIVIDISRVPVLYVDNTIDVTQAFIAEYNRRPRTASTAAPAGNRP
jgi:Skp family chaperone for outer membrane proteins